MKILLLFLSILPVMLTAQDGSRNYILTTEMLDSVGEKSIQSVEYFDGVGRSVQTLTGGLNTSGTYLCTVKELNAEDQLIRQWSPVKTNTLAFMSDEEIQSALSSTYQGESHPFTLFHYDGLGRVKSQIRPGAAWNDKPTVQEYSINTENRQVKKYTLSGTVMGYYDPGTLTSVTSIDEDDIQVTVFKNMFGNKVLEERGKDVQTYYVYDEFNQLRLVLQPKYQEDPDLSKYAFQYFYDDLGRCRKKILPGCDSVVYEYDNADRVIKMQDGLLRAKKKYRIYTYDGLGRLKKQSISNGTSVEYDEIVNFYDDYAYLKQKPYSDMIPKNNVDDTDMAPLDSLRGFGQLTGVLQRASNGEFLLMSYSYDEYGRVVLTKEIGIDKHLAAMGYSYNFVGDLDYDACDLYRYDKSVGKLNDNSLYSWTKHYFHESNNKLPYRSVIHLTHKGSTKQTNDEIMKSTYDDFGNMIANDRKGTAGDMTYAYDNLHGWLKQIGSASGFSQTLFRETGADNPRWNGSISAMTWNVGDFVNRTYNYTYDGLNRLISADYSSNINASGSAFADPELRGLLPWDCLQENYSESFRYDKNCNITFIERMGTTNTQKGQEIDVLALEYNGNQLKNVCDYSGINLTYSGAFDFVDREDMAQEYAYNGNGSMTKDLNKDITNIEYDLLGNPRKVTMTNNRSIEYVYAADGRKLRTVHSAPVARLPRDTESKAASGKGVAIPVKPRINIKKTTTDYINNYVFENDKPVMYRFPGGYYSFDAEGNMDGCHFYVQDYQGNNRMVVNAYADTVEQVNHYYSYGALMGDISTNPDEQKYKYGGKELDRTYGLDLHDFEARQQDPSVGRFTSIDPMAEKYYWLSPYSYCAGDPINLVDPTGMDVCILIEPSGAGGFGHMAILIQRPDQKWYLYSKNGVQSSVNDAGEGVTIPSGPNDCDKGDETANVINPETKETEEVGFDSPQEFIDSKYNKDSDGNVMYSEGYIIESTKNEDTAARNAACEEIAKPYNLFGSNCAYTVQKALEAAGKSSGHFKLGTDNGLQQLLIPKGRYRMITRENKGVYVRPSNQGPSKKIKL